LKGAIKSDRLDCDDVELEERPAPVVGLREGSWLEVKGSTITLKGNLRARVFQKGMPPVEIESGTVV